MPSTTYIIQHLPHIPAGQLLPLLNAKSIPVQVIKAWQLKVTELEEIFAKIRSSDSLIVLGGSMHAYAEADYPWISLVRELLAKRLEATGKTLGICLGHQLAAVGLGGEVTVGALEPAEKAKTLLTWEKHPWVSQIFGNCPPRSVFSDHSDVVTNLPRSAQLLAANENGVQAVAYSENYLTVQFHPEVNESVLTSWYSETEPAYLPEALSVYKHEKTTLEATAKTLVNWWIH
ncbi:MAG: type 1 glutamine amidotransferase [Actinomycetaceae bacterium]|nr:type 1 glutamine amidotransferase [Actinomycetaceae bacterium]